jgi:hypothetical protein
MGIGLGYATGTAEPDFSGAPEIDLSGLAIPVELSLGGTVGRGVVLGVGSFGASIPTLTLETSSDFGDLETETDAVLSTIGPFIDVYPNPEQGLHIQAGVAYAVIAASEDDDELLGDDYAGGGFALMAGVGYEWWVGEQWSVGVLGRIQYASATLEADSGDLPDSDVSLIVPAALFTATLH